MEYDHAQGDENGLKTATIMRNDFQALTDRIAEAEDSYMPTKADIPKLLVAAMITTNQLQDKVKALKKAITGYQTDVIPKLQNIMDSAKTDDEVKQLVEEKFIIEDNE